MSTIIAAVIAPIITASLAAIGVWWKGRRDRRRGLTEVHEEINVIEAWIKAYGLVASRETKSQAWKRAESDLERAYERLAVLLDLSRGVEMRPTFGQHVKILMLIHSAQTRATEIMRILYYVSLVGVATWVSVITAVGISQPNDAGSLILGFVVLLIANLLISAGIYMLARHLDRRARAAAAGTQRIKSPEVVSGALTTHTADVEVSD